MSWWRLRGERRPTMRHAHVRATLGIVALPLLALLNLSAPFASEAAADAPSRDPRDASHDQAHSDQPPLRTVAAGTTSGVAASDRPITLSPPPVAAVERMCALLTSCPKLPFSSFGGPAAQDVGACVAQMSSALTRADAVTFSLTLRECALTAMTCDQLRTCALRGVKPDACAERDKRGTVGFCDESGRAVTCVRGEVGAVRDCPRGGEECSASRGVATCTLGSCAPLPGDAGVSGANANGVPYCSASGTHLLECTNSKLTSVDCSAFGLSCVTVDAASGGVGCAPPMVTGGACDPFSAPTAADGPVQCDGGVAVGCLRGRQVRVDCAAAGLMCGGTGAPVGLCRTGPTHGDDQDDGAPCTDGKAGTPRCDGKSIVYCAAGRTRHVSCDALGMNRCVKDAHGARCH